VRERELAVLCDWEPSAALTTFVEFAFYNKSDIIIILIIVLSYDVGVLLKVIKPMFLVVLASMSLFWRMGEPPTWVLLIVSTGDTIQL